jgi:Fe-S-cluster containining protein
MPTSTERLNLSITTTAGELHAQLDVPHGFVPITAIVPVVRSLGEQAQHLEETNMRQAGHTISCQKGCAACCRILIPVSPPEAFSLLDAFNQLPPDQQARVRRNLTEAHHRLQEAGLLDTLRNLAESSETPSDDELEPINQAYYALRLPCVFLEQELCTIYDERPSGCRSHLASTPPEWCQDMERRPVRILDVPVRAGTVLSLLWAKLTNSTPRLIPLPVALEWAEAHQDLRSQTWQGAELFEGTMEGLGNFLQHTFASLSQQKPDR